MRKKRLVYLIVSLAIAMMAVKASSETLHELTPTVSGRTWNDDSKGFRGSEVIVGGWSDDRRFENISWLKFEIPEYPGEVITRVLINSNITNSYNGPFTPGVEAYYVSDDSWKGSTIHYDWPATSTVIRISGVDASYPSLHSADITSWLSLEGEGKSKTLSVKLVRAGGGTRGGMLGNGTPSLTITTIPESEMILLKKEQEAMMSRLAQPVPADKPPDFVPLGVYLSWELPEILGKYYKADRWEDLRRRLDACVENHIDTLWVTNMSEADLPRLIEECERRGIKLLPMMGGYDDAMVQRLVKIAGNSKTLAGWVLSDEPGESRLPDMENLRLAFRKADPDRFCLVVSQWTVTPEVPKKTNLPVVCVVLYPFFGPNDPNGPHTDSASQNYLRTNARRMIDAIGDKNAVGWLMGQCFVEIWGPWKIDDRDHFIALPGAYLHWRCPTLAEIRWQVWETFRSQCKGVFIFQLCPVVSTYGMGIGPETAKNPSPDVAWKDVLVKEPTDAGPGALTNPACTATPQLRELGKVYQSIAPYKAIIHRWKATPLLLVEAESPGSVQCFIDSSTQRYYCVVVNDDLHQQRSITLNIEARQAKGVVDLISNKPVSLKSLFGNGMKSGIVTLDAGAGTILEIVRTEGNISEK